MKITEAPLPGVLHIEPRVFDDARGFFLETWSRARYREAGIKQEFVQDNLSYSSRGTLRGLHYQYPRGQGKLVQVYTGEVFDVAVDIRSDSPTFGQWFGKILTAEKRNQLYVPPGFAHGFYVLSEAVLFGYKCTDYYSRATEGGVQWNDPAIGISWPLQGEPILSAKDVVHGPLAQIPRDQLPTMEASA
ncbi:dTDP-4-dehydrorhamnose 3,5-epimerase [Planctomycetota bacterium]